MLLESAGWDYSVSLVKGRGRYLCPLKLEQCLDTAQAKDAGAFLFEDEITFNPTANIIESYRAMDQSLKEGSWLGDRDSWSDVLEDVDWRPADSRSTPMHRETLSIYYRVLFFQGQR